MRAWDWLKRVMEWPEPPVEEPVAVAEPEPEPEPTVAAPSLVHLPDEIRRAKVGANIRRFKLALEQCTKGPERQAELRAWLDYWKAQKAAAARKPEAR